MTAKQMKMAGMALSVMLLGAMAQAQEGGRLQKGDRTFMLGGSGSSNRDFAANFDAHVASLELGLSWFIADNVAFTVRQGVSFAKIAGTSDWNGSSRLGLDFFLDLDRFQPFVGAEAGLLYGETVKSQFVAGPNAGVLFFMNDTTFFNLGVVYQFLFENADEVSGVYNDGRFVYALGMGVKW